MIGFKKKLWLLGFWMAAGASAALAWEDPPGMKERVEALLGKMTVEEKIGQTHLLTSDWTITGPSIRGDYQQTIQAGKLGSVFNAYTAAYTRKLQEMAVKTRLGIPLLFGYDVIHGHRTIFPIPLGEAASWDLEAIEKAARVAAVEATAEGIHWTFAPMVDIARDPRWGRIMEGAGEDVLLGSRIGAARVRGFQGKDLAATDTLLACAKHYAAYGAAQAGRDYHTADISQQTLRSVYLPPFKAAVDAGVTTFMASFNEVDGIPATAHRQLLTEVLRGDWGFQGFVVTDYTGIAEMINHGYARDMRHAAQLSLAAGVDMDMQSSAFSDHFPDLLAKNEITLAQLDGAVRRVLSMKARLGLLDDPFRYCDPTREKEMLYHADHLAFAREASTKSIVLLKNEGDTLPLRDVHKKIALIGPLARDRRNLIGAWCAAGDWRRAVGVEAALRERLEGKAQIRYVRGCPIQDADRSGFAAAVEAAKWSDIVVAVMGEAAWMSGEASSRSEIGLPGVQRALLEELKATGKPVVLVLMNGRPLTLEWEAANLPALVETWFLGTMAGPAIVDVLTGAVNPSGKLPVTFPRRLGQIPLHYDMKNTGRPYSDKDPKAKYVSRYLDVPNTPLFPFGHGLSYTRFAYGDPVLDRTEMKASDVLKVTVTVKNTGERAGTEVVQLYLRDLVGSVTRPVKELKDFARVTLEPGEERAVEFRVGADQLAFLRQDMTHGTEPGEHEVQVGGSSADVKTARFTLNP